VLIGIVAWDEYQNNVARVTDNVLREFLRRKKGDRGVLMYRGIIKARCDPRYERYLQRVN
jgi:hypothetical protein